MEVNRNNYEVYFIDYFDGSLNLEEKEQLVSFLSNNPDLKNEFDEFKKYNKSEAEKVYKYKDELKKQISDLGPVSYSTIDEYCIAYLENDLDETEKKNLLNAINTNADFKKTFNLFQKTKLFPDETIYYTRKGQLKHFVINRKFILRVIGYSSAAAILLLGFFLINPSKDIQSNLIKLSEVIENKKPVEKIEIEGMDSIKENNLEFITVIPEKESKRISIKNESIEIQNREMNRLNKIESKTINTICYQSKESTMEINKPEVKDQYTANEIQTYVKNLQELNADSLGYKKINLWTIAEVGVKVFNILNEKNFDIKPNYAGSGKLKSVTFKTERRSITTPAI